MVRSLCIFLFSFVLYLAIGQNSEEYTPYQEGVDPEFLSDLRSRFECSIGTGYSHINNLTPNAFTSDLADYSQKLANGIKADVGIGYNITNHLQVKIQYAFRTSKASGVFVWQDSNNAESLIHISNHYYFNQLGAGVQYRFRILGERLFLVPELGAAYLFYKNEGEYNVSYIQQSNGWMLNTGLGIDYLASDIIGIGLHSNYSYTTFPGANVEYETPVSDTSIPADTEFNFWDVSIKFMVFF